ncbi:hypothetical protein FQU76_01270 [Streptomyces qinzhouensis]|uniref:Uncharacterized protein n=1 Tax=Streptomyces qinzhouensis TaxID=2599401 RepID=A0A5B8J0Y8_9ACTN|nr:hypothetical protein FQU76_01270 [Streptomyces qinzhouensis]
MVPALRPRPPCGQSAPRGRGQLRSGCSPRARGWSPDAAPGRVRLVDAPLGEAVGRLVAEIRVLRPDIVITYDALGQMTRFPVKFLCSDFLAPQRALGRGAAATA